MDKYWTPLVKRLTPYVPGEQRNGKNIIKLNTNENPYPPTPQVKQAIASIDEDAIRRYPDPESDELRRALANYHHVQQRNVFVGNGSDEVLALAFMAYFTGGKPLQFPEIGYSFYPVYCDLLNITPTLVPIDSDFKFYIDQFENNGGGIVFANPNAPTSLAVSAADIETLLKRVPDTLVFVDEAYADFGAESVIHLINQYPNLLVGRTYSKGRSMAGMRLGAAFADQHIIDGLLRVKNSFNSYPLDVIAQKAGLASLSDEAYYRSCVEKIVATRDWISAELRQRSFKVLDSKSNFIFASPTSISAGKLFAALSEQDILVRYWDKPALRDWLRISIGTNDDMQKLVAAVDRIVRQ